MGSFGHTQLYSYSILMTFFMRKRGFLLDKHNYILMISILTKFFMRSFGHTQLYSNGILY